MRSTVARSRKLLQPSMEDEDLFLAMLGLSLAAVMLVAGGLFLITREEPLAPPARPIPALMSSLDMRGTVHHPKQNQPAGVGLVVKEFATFRPCPHRRRLV